MIKFRKTIAVCLIAVLGIVSFTSCGEEEVKKAEAPKHTSLKSSVTMTVADGDAYGTVGKLSGDIKLNKVEDQAEVLRTLKRGDSDFAVLTPIEAARYYNEKGGIKVVSTLSLGEWEIAVNDFEGNPADEEDLVKLGGQYLVGIKDDPVASEDEEEALAPVDGQLVDPTGQVEQDANGTWLDAEGNPAPLDEEGNLIDAEGNPIELTEPEEPIELKEMSEEVFQTLMAKEGYGFFDGQIEWKNLDEVEDYISTPGATILANQNNLKKATTGLNEFTEVYSLNELWGKDFGKEIPGYVLVATDKFLEKRNYEVEGVLDIIADTLEENQKGTDLKLVAYNMSNRGVAIVRDFLDILADYNLEAVDGEKVDNGFYWSGK